MRQRFGPADGSGSQVRAVQAITLDDGSGAARIYFLADNLSRSRRPYMQVGEVWTAQGVVGQYAFKAPWEGSIG